jgi:hypothetical protein
MSRSDKTRHAQPDAMSADSPSHKLARILDREIPEDRIAQTLSECMAATSTGRNGVLEPDFRTRLAATQLALAYKVGRPVERQEIVQVNLNADSAIGLRERLRHSPALRKSLAGLLAEAGASEGAEV